MLCHNWNKLQQITANRRKIQGNVWMCAWKDNQGMRAGHLVAPFQKCLLLASFLNQDSELLSWVGSWSMFNVLPELSQSLYHRNKIFNHKMNSSSWLMHLFHSPARLSSQIIHPNTDFWAVQERMPGLNLKSLHLATHTHTDTHSQARISELNKLWYQAMI